ncbi:MAG: phosphoribosylformylglycinamidine cyclo-ligase, partial [Bacteroidales bacterium]|nr:phosphoribosylformylglycinamidine cyclo-ligase [Bacteroidales bacterium]
IKDNMLPIPPLFNYIQEASATPWEEMYKVFNMGHRLEAYVPEEIASELIAISKSYQIDAQIIGHCETCDVKKVSVSSPHGNFIYG